MHTHELRLRLRQAAAALLFSVALVRPAAAEVVWASWLTGTAGPQGSATGTVNGVGVTYSGELLVGRDEYSVLAAYTDNFFDPAAPFVSAAVPDGPPPGFHPTAYGGTQSGVHRLAFDRPVTDLVMAIYSLGRPNVPVTLDFDRPFTLLGTADGWWNFAVGALGAPYVLTQSGTRLTGLEANGAILFSGTFAALEWTSPGLGEGWHGITVGVLQPVPEPGTWGLVAAGLLVFATLARRRPG